MNNNEVTIVGPGRVGQTIALLLQEQGFKIREFIARCTDKVSFRSPSLTAISILPIATTTNLASIIIITVVDSAIEAVAAELANLKEDWRGHLILHCSGAFSSQLLKTFQARGGEVGSLHPLKSMTFPQVEGNELLNSFVGSYWCLEGDEGVAKFASQFVAQLKGRLVAIATEVKPIYHAAAVMACGHLVSLVDMSCSLMTEAGIEEQQALQMLLPLIHSTIDNLANGTATALTGPFARRDEKTIASHLQALMKLKKDYITLYTLLGHHSLLID